MTPVDFNTFDTTVKAATKPVIVVFFMEGTVASARLLKRAGELDANKFTVLTVDVNKAPELVQRFSLRQVPYLMKILSSGELIAAGNVLSEIVSA